MFHSDLSFDDYKKENKILKIVIICLICSVFFLLLAFLFGNKLQYNVLVAVSEDAEYFNYVVEKGASVSSIQKPTRSGYEFLYWKMNGKKCTDQSKITKNAKLIAVWGKIYTVSFDTDGGSAVPSQKVTENKKAVEPTPPNKVGYLFSGWSFNANTYDFNSKVTSDVVLKAIWTKTDKKSYNVIFDSVGGSNVSSQTIIEGGKAILPSSPTKNGYTFVNWMLNGKTYNFDSVITSNITLVANWKKTTEQSQQPQNPQQPQQPVPEKKKYTVIFDSAGGSNVSSQTIIEGGKVSEPSAPSKNDFVFAGWFLNGNKYDFNSGVTSNITLTAKWNQVVKNYTITATAVDAYSPDRILKVYENGSLVSFSQIQYIDGTVICTGSNPTVSAVDIEGESNFIVILSNGGKVNAKKV